jgi:hypothetical protein
LLAVGVQVPPQLVTYRLARGKPPAELSRLATDLPATSGAVSADTVVAIVRRDSLNNLVEVFHHRGGLDLTRAY